MFSVGDALLVAVILCFVVWVLKRRWPAIFGSELNRTLKLTNDNVEGKLQRDWILVVLQKELDRRGLVGGGVHGAKDGNTVPIRFPDSKAGPVEAAGFSNRADSNVGRAHVAEDGAFAGGLVKERPDYLGHVVEDQPGRPVEEQAG